MNWRGAGAASDGPMRASRRLHGRVVSPAVIGAALLALLAVLVASWTVSTQLTERSERETRERFEFDASEVALRIEERFRGYRQVLRSGRALFAASDHVDRDEWRIFVETLRLDEDYAGILGFGFAEWVLAPRLDEHVVDVVAEGFADYRVWPEGEREAYSAIVMLEPFHAVNRRAFGFDMYSEPVRREAMDRAVRTGRGVLSGRVVLVQESEGVEPPGVVFYLPVYRNTPTRLKTEATGGRDAYRDLRGWVYSPFRTQDLVWESIRSLPDGLRLRIHDAADDASRLLFDSAANGGGLPQGKIVTRIQRSLHLDGREWVLLFDAHPAYGAAPRGLELELAAIALLGLLFVIVTWALTTTRERARALAMAATHDPLTGVPNRQYFTDRLSHTMGIARRYGHRMALLFVDLDNFKEVNDNHGHVAGDRLLIEAVARMRGCIRDTDMLSRHGGDEFLVLLPRIASEDDALRVAEKIRVALDRPFELGGRVLVVSSSIGIVVFPDDADNEDGLLRLADEAMYRAKSAGRNQVCRYRRAG